MRVRANMDSTHQGHKRIVAVPGSEFIGRLLQHVLPCGFKRIRYCGLLAPAAKTARLALARRLLQQTQPNPTAVQDAQAFMRRVAGIDIERCPHCKLGHWRLVQVLAADRAALGALLATPCRGPP